MKTGFLSAAMCVSTHVDENEILENFSKKNREYVPIILDVVGGHGGVGDAIIDDGVDRHRYRVP